MTGKEKLNVQKALTQAQTLTRCGALDDALKLYRSILDRFPKNKKAQEGWRKAQCLQARKARPQLTNQLIEAAFTLLSRGDLTAALKEARLLTTAYPDQPVLQNFLGICLFETGDSDAALAAYRRSLALKEVYPEASLNLAIALERLGQVAEARGHALAALRFRPDYADAISLLGKLAEREGNSEEAIRLLEKAVALDPKAIAAQNNLGLAHKHMGDFDLAEAAFKKAITLNPQGADLHANYAEIHRYEPGDPHKEQMETLVANPDQPARERFPLCFALAKACEETGALDASFDWLVEANHLRKSVFSYDPADTDIEFRNVVDLANNLRSQSGMRPIESSLSPVFIVGLPRSGTSLIEQVLASHPRVHGAGELNYLNEFFEPLCSADVPGAPTHGSLKAFARTYLVELAKRAGPASFVTDKMPLNFRWIGPLLSLFAGARIFHITRDPVATCWSMFKRNFTSTGNGFAYDLQDLADYHRQYCQLMRTWHEMFPGRILDISYETFVDDLQGETRSILAELGLDWDPACLDFHKTKRSVLTWSATQVRQPLYKGSSESWKEFAGHLKPLTDALAG
jgi:tetratricopeptide (TPR) repeat protein